MIDIKKGKQVREEKKKDNLKQDSVSEKNTFNFAHSFSIVKEPHITEKSSIASESNQYSFKVWPRANKILIKKEIENIYKVQVEKVRIINIHSKKRQLGRSQGHKTGYKKAIVTLKPGQKIEILPK